MLQQAGSTLQSVGTEAMTPTRGQESGSRIDRVGMSKLSGVAKGDQTSARHTLPMFKCQDIPHRIENGACGLRC